MTVGITVRDALNNAVLDAGGLQKVATVVGGFNNAGAAQTITANANLVWAVASDTTSFLSLVGASFTLSRTTTVIVLLNFLARNNSASNTYQYISCGINGQAVPDQQIILAPNYRYASGALNPQFVLPAGSYFPVVYTRTQAVAAETIVTGGWSIFALQLGS